MSPDPLQPPIAEAIARLNACGAVPYDPARHAPEKFASTGSARPPYTGAQLAAGQALASAVLEHGRYGYQDAAQIARCYANHTPTLPRLEL